MTNPAQEESGSLSATGERLVPELQHGELVHAEHLVRYRFAAQLARDRRVLDAASGEGYGTALLSAAGAKSAVGIDIDRQAVEHARRRYGLDFQVGDVGALPFRDRSFDLVVSFETVEHVGDPERAISELRRVLADDGVLVISTPNAHEYLVDNEFHEREFTHEEFVAMLADHFARVEVLLQHNWLTSAVLPQDVARDAEAERAHRVDLYKAVGVEPGRELYTVAVCGAASDGPAHAVAVMAGTDEAHELARRLVTAEETAERWHTEYLQAKETAELWHREYKGAKRTAEEFRDALEGTAANLDEVYNSFSWRMTEPLRRLAQFVRGARG